MTNAKTRQSVSQSGWADVDDTALVRALLDEDGQAWREFWRRYNGLLGRRIRAHLRDFPRLSSSDTCEDVKSEVLVALLSNDRMRLRQFSHHIGSLDSWLGLIAEQVTFKYVMATHREDATVREALARGVSDEAQQAARWLNRETSIAFDPTGLRLCGFVEERGETYAWFGGDVVRVFDQDGRELRAFAVRTRERTPTEAEAERAMRRAMKRALVEN